MGGGGGEGGLEQVRERRGTVKYPSGDGLPEILETRLACVTACEKAVFRWLLYLI